jgi:hypothetical protein
MAFALMGKHSYERETMSSILDSIQQQIGPAVQQVSQRLGVDPAIAQQAVNVAVPVITAAIASHARSGGADTIHREATKQAINPQASTSLPSVLGDQHSAIAQRVSDVTGVSREDAGNILGALAPAVMRGIGQHVQQEGINAGQLATVLNSVAAGGQNFRGTTNPGEARL